MTGSRELFQSITRSLDGIAGPIGLAVSGGGDSVAMLRLVAEWAQSSNVRLFVYSVDHGLRESAAGEVKFVAGICETLGVDHRALKWADWSGEGNLPAEARKARYDLIADAARKDGTSTVLLAHTIDDQAETVLMALARRSGVDGLSGMPLAREDRGITWLRPLLGQTRQSLRDYLRDIGQNWVDDPTNEDTAYERVRMRQAKEVLDELGLTGSALSDVAENMQRVRQQLEISSAEALERFAQPIAGAVKLSPALLSEAEETARRVLMHCLCWVAPLSKTARRDAILRSLRQLAEGQSVSLQGCLVLAKKNAIWVVREPAAADQVCRTDEIWDGKWRVSGPDTQTVHALGEDGLALCPDWRDSGLPGPVLLSSPAIWSGPRLIAAPLAGYGASWSAETLRKDKDFHNAPVRR